MNVKDFISFAGYTSGIPLLCGALIFRVVPKPIRYLTILAGFALITEIISTVLAKENTSNLFLFHIYPSIEFVLFLLIYQTYFRSGKEQKALRAIGGLFLLFSIFNTLFIQHIREFNTHGRALECLLLVVLSIAYLQMKILKVGTPDSQDRSMFWINTAVLLYFPLNLVFFLMSNYLLKHIPDQLHITLWTVHAYLSIAQYLLFTIAIYTAWRRQKSPALS